MSRNTPAILATLLALFTLALTANSSAQSATFDQRTYPGRAVYTHADLNNDGREDFAYGRAGDSGFWVLNSSGDGIYSAPVNYPVPDGTPSGVAIGDLNGDGFADIIAFNPGHNGFYEFLNRGDGTFHLQATVELSSPPVDLVTGDFNHDGKIDIAFSTHTGSGLQTDVHVWFGNGDGGFTTGPTTTTLVGDTMYVVDFDGDGKADLLVEAFGATTSSMVYFGDGSGHFPSSVDTTQEHGAQLRPMDLNGDG